MTMSPDSWMIDNALAAREEYNGYPNRETWAVALHVNNDQALQERVHEALRAIDLSFPGGPTAPGEIERAYAFHAGQEIERLVQEWIHEWLIVGDPRELVNVLTDLGSLWRVEWMDLGETFMSDLAEV